MPLSSFQRNEQCPTSNAVSRFSLFDPLSAASGNQSPVVCLAKVTNSSIAKSLQLTAKHTAGLRVSSQRNMKPETVHCSLLGHHSKFAVFNVQNCRKIKPSRLTVWR